MAGSADLFPLTPFYPIGEDAIDRKVRLMMDSGKQYIRSKGIDLTIWELTGECSGAERQTVLQFYEDHAQCGCTLSDQRYSPAEDHIVQFQARPKVRGTTYGKFVWECNLVETTLV